MARVTIEDCLDKIDNHFDLVLIASHRAHQLQSGAAPKIDPEGAKPAIIALREIAAGLTGKEILEEPLVKDATAEAELAELIEHGLMNQTIENNLGVLSENPEEETMDTLETGPSTIDEMEKIADLNLDHLKGGDETPREEDMALAKGLSEGEIAMGENLLSKVGETPAEPAALGMDEGLSGVAKSLSAIDNAAGGNDQNQSEKDGAAEKEPD